MRAVLRPKVALPTLRQIRNDYPFDETGTALFPLGLWNKPDVRGALYAMHGRVCAYCGGPASDRRGDVEHYRPKSEYPWLTYEFTNYLLGCRRCNSSRKGKKFPLAPSAAPLRYDDRMISDADFLRAALATEARLLLDPADDPIDEWLTVDYQNDETQVVPTGAEQSHPFGKRRVSETIAFFRLNTTVELVQQRNVQVMAAIFALRKWQEGEAVKADAVRMLANRYTPHGWAVRRVASALTPAFPLPNAEDDLKWLVEETLQSIAIADRMLSRPLRVRERHEILARKEEASWTLAVLWRDPPDVPAATVGEWINAAGRRDEIEVFLNRLA